MNTTIINILTKANKIRKKNNINYKLLSDLSTPPLILVQLSISYGSCNFYTTFYFILFYFLIIMKIIFKRYSAMQRNMQIPLTHSFILFIKLSRYFFIAAKHLNVCFYAQVYYTGIYFIHAVSALFLTVMRYPALILLLSI